MLKIREIYVDTDWFYVTVAAVSKNSEILSASGHSKSEMTNTDSSFIQFYTILNTQCVLCSLWFI